MSEDAIKKLMRRLIEKSWHILDRESFHVWISRGKAANVCDFICVDKSGYRLIKVCYGTITPPELSRLLRFNDCRDPNTIIEILFWEKHQQQPFHRAKLYYNSPEQPIPATLKKLVK